MFSFSIALVVIIVVIAIVAYAHLIHENEGATNHVDPDSVRFDVENLEEISVLDDLKEIKGIGPAREKKLLDEFGTNRAVMHADDEELEEFIPGRVIERLRDKAS